MTLLTSTTLLFLAALVDFSESIFFCCGCPAPFNGGCNVAPAPAPVSAPIYYPPLPPPPPPPPGPYFVQQQPYLVLLPVPVPPPIPVPYRETPPPTTKPPPPPPKPTEPPKPVSDDPCYVNESGFHCCDRTLEEEMHKAYDAYKASELFSPCNIGAMAAMIQKAAQARFNLSFEVIVALKPFGGSSHYEGNYACRFAEDDKHFFAYATPIQYDVSNQASEKTLAEADATHDATSLSDYWVVKDNIKQERVAHLNTGLPSVKSTGVKLEIRRQRSAFYDYLSGRDQPEADTCFIHFNKVNESRTFGSRSWVTNEVTMGTSSLAVRRQREPTC